ncbi:MAG: nucleoside triphosphate pyrophosphohydrolase [Candidatus Marinimicrobia bacterium]|nr:nucleoside triphosphate pyrophosphohydrolase [Candidatus Neomarinimicrobiota bacterium]
MKLEKKNNTLEDLIRIVKKLRSPYGCEWDNKQTHESLIPYLLEESHEVVEAIQSKDYNLLKEELGDLFLHLIFQVDLAEAENRFLLEDVFEGINSKLIKRHPHIFYDKDDPRWKEGNWEESKQKEKKRDSILEGVPISLPALLRSRRIQEKAAMVGFDWDKLDQVLAKVDEEVGELKESIVDKKGIADELGDVLFTVVNLSRHLDINPEQALNDSTNKFMKRFKKIEKELKDKKIDMKSLSLEELDVLWEKNK